MFEEVPPVRRGFLGLRRPLVIGPFVIGGGVVAFGGSAGIFVELDDSDRSANQQLRRPA
ncbi:MAG TPA: hypothetical protein VJ851_17330 [Jatrophihabitans sp.]|nr:hypothetical protein [Jatrophihabitans sp.]